MKRSIFILSLSLCFAAAGNAQPGLEQLWSSDSVLKVPESVLYSKQEKLLFVANIDGQPGEKDGKGSIGKVGLDGKIIKVDWLTGLNAPKGMAISGGSLWVADVDHMAEIDIKAGTIKRTIPIAGSEFLNDVTAAPDGRIFVSDSKGRKVYVLTNGTPSVFLDNLKGPNGLLYYAASLYVLDAGSLLKAGKDKKLETLASGMDGSTDGIEHVKGNDFLVLCWTGVIYYVHGDGKTEQLLDTRESKVNSADIGYDAANRVVYVPTFFKNNVVAYKLSVK